MVCRTVKLPGTWAIVCSRGQKPKRCKVCGEFAEYICDFPIGAGKACDRPMCVNHRKRVGDNRDHCVVHAHHDTQGELL